MGIDDLATVFPDIAAEWDYGKNGSLLPTHVLPYSNRRVWWLCPAGHSVQALISSRTRHWGCRKCATSKIENLLEKALQASPLVKNVEHGAGLPVPWRTQKIAWVDLLVQTNDGQKTIIEYDGLYWHRDKEDQDTDKTLALLAAGYKVIRVREADLFLLRCQHPSFRQFNFGTKKGTDVPSLVRQLESLLS